MSRPVRHQGRGGHPAFWRVTYPSLGDIISVFRAGQRAGVLQSMEYDGNFRYIVHGKTRVISPDFAERNKDEAAAGEVTRAYSRDPDTIAKAIIDAKALVEEEYPNIDELPTDLRDQLHATTFANLAWKGESGLLNPGEDNYWLEIHWIDVVDTSRAEEKRQDDLIYKHTLTDREKRIGEAEAKAQQRAEEREREARRQIREARQKKKE